MAAEIIKIENYLEFGSWNAVKEKGRIENVSRDYIVKDGDVINILAH